MIAYDDTLDCLPHQVLSESEREEEATLQAVLLARKLGAPSSLGRVHAECMLMASECMLIASLIRCTFFARAAHCGRFRLWWEPWRRYGDLSTCRRGVPGTARL